METCRIGVFICACGTNIAKIIDVEAVAQTISKLPDIILVKTYKYMCSNPGQEMISQNIKEHKLNRIVVAACSPNMHERTFRQALQVAELNQYMLEMVNIREQCSWVHKDTVEATRKAISLIYAAINRVKLHDSLENLSVKMNPEVLVIGGGIAGMTTALELADAGYFVHIVEKNSHLGGNLSRVDLTAPYFYSARDLISERITRTLNHTKIHVYLNSKVTKITGYVGNFEAEISKLNGNSKEKADVIKIGNIAVCTGYKEFDASRVTHYGYGKLQDVITSFDLEKMLKKGQVVTSSGKPPKYVAIIHCVGSRNVEFHAYCSRVCCMTALKYAHEIKSAIPDCYISDIYIDMHAFGKGHEDFYLKSSEAKTLFLMYEKNDRPVIHKAKPKDDCNLLIEVNERLSGEHIEIPADLVVLMVGMEARADAEEVAHLVNISQDKDGWFIESHPKLEPVATSTDGVFIAGTCVAPKDIPDTVAQARAAAARILARISKGEIEVDAVFSEVNPDLCSGCRFCNKLCPFSAITFNEEEKHSEVISALCKACGVCVSACPSSAIKGRHFTDKQILAQIDGICKGNEFALSYENA
ncbi:MAG TPA: CoB--CoM heterodisulfide reductase iron-sulfur subunit A family protein [Bacteroidia bacterium]|nr:CoB--CoM heterodisulfide reductase iron-sulfur subunit A family protein [Bacteroidia bacterium]HRS58784.1 CoB--CoM heterodisulfide reductase iron-sulfur subunit A family protein [Bacteroidia bacterium]HRU68154.1 CoB--CoM heterodisulfide reductase iron-sulfur subunit A family protein [Bacteroidia bacterium]